MRRGEVSVARCHSRRLVPHEFLNGREIDALHDEPAGEGVPQVVPMEVGDLRLLEGGGEDPVDEVPGVERRFHSVAWEDWSYPGPVDSWTLSRVVSSRWLRS